MKNSISITISVIVLLAYVKVSSSTPKIYDDEQTNIVDYNNALYRDQSYENELYQQQPERYQHTSTHKAAAHKHICDCGLGNHITNDNAVGHNHLSGIHSYRRQHHEQPHEQFHDTPFYFHKHGTAHFYPPIAVLGR